MYLNYLTIQMFLKILNYRLCHFTPKILMFHYYHLYLSYLTIQTFLKNLMTPKFRYYHLYHLSLTIPMYHSTPMNLMTTNDVPFLEYPDYGQWRAVFGHDRARAPTDRRLPTGRNWPPRFGLPLRDRLSGEQDSSHSLKPRWKRRRSGYPSALRWHGVRQQPAQA